MTAAAFAVLLVEDEPHIRQFLRKTLEAENYRVIEAEAARRGLIEAGSHKPDLAIIDLGLPDQDGIEVIRGIRGWSTLPIIVLSARTQEAQKVAALDTGADDYITKPFGVDELLARVRVALRHRARGAQGFAELHIGRYRIDLAKRRASAADGSELHLTPIEYRLLDCLAQHAGIVVTHRQLLKEVWGPSHIGEPQYLRVYMRQLRAKLEPDPLRPKYFLTETGIGYRFQPDEC